MQNPASSPRADNCSDLSGNKHRVRMFQGALRPVANAHPSAADAPPAAHQAFSDSASQVPREEVSDERLGSAHSFIATSPVMRQVSRQIEQLAAIDEDLLVRGESGTGKEVVARMIHKLSARASNAFFTVNCAALPVELLEGELYGHEAGALPGTAQLRSGKFESADKGTLFLDDIDGLPLASQPRLLHVLQGGVFARLDATSTMQCDVRVIAATDLDLRSAMQDGTFRADLFYQLSGFTIYLPPLRERKEDLPHLLNHFMNHWSEEYKRQRLPITHRILDACAEYSWPGNVRELENFVKRYLILGEENLALDQLEMGPMSPTASDAEAVRIDLAGRDICDLKSVVRDLKQDAEKAAIIQTLERTRGNKQEAASLLHISLRSLHYKVRAYGIGPASLRFPDAAVGTTPSAEGTAGSGTTKAAAKIITMARSGIR